MRYLLLLPLALLACDSGGPDPAVLDLSGPYESRFGHTGNLHVGTASWDVDGTDIRLEVDVVDGAELVETITMEGSYFVATNDMRLTGTFTGPAGYSGTALYEATVSLGGEEVTGRWEGTYSEDPPDGPNPRVETLTLTRD